MHEEKRNETRNEEDRYIKTVSLPAETQAAEPGQHLFSQMIPVSNLYCSVAQDFGKANIYFVSE